MKVSYEDVIKNEQIAIFIEKADMTLAQLGYTEHSFIHAGKVTQVAGMILEELMFSKRDIELAKIAGYMHDIGNVINRTDHAQSGADRAPLVIIKGMAGTAKTFYSLAVGLEKVYNNPDGEYRRIVICRPNAQFDDDIGFNDSRGMCKK